MNTESTTPRKTFIKISNDPKFTRDLLKEAKRVGYTVKVTSEISREVTDPENGDALVFKTCKMRPGITSIIFSTTYWKDPLL